MCCAMLTTTKMSVSGRRQTSTANTFTGRRDLARAASRFGSDSAHCHWLVIARSGLWTHSKSLAAFCLRGEWHINTFKVNFITGAVFKKNYFPRSFPKVFESFDSSSAGDIIYRWLQTKNVILWSKFIKRMLLTRSHMFDNWLSH